MLIAKRLNIVVTGRTLGSYDIPVDPFIFTKGLTPDLDCHWKVRVPVDDVGVLTELKTEGFSPTHKVWSPPIKLDPKIEFTLTEIDWLLAHPTPFAAG